MESKIRLVTYTLSSYLKKIINEEIRTDQDVQRLSDQWDRSMNNELIYTVLCGDYISPVILGEEHMPNDTVQLWLIDGLQRSSCLSMFRYGNYKISSSLENPVIEYQKIALDEDGNQMRDSEGNLVREIVEYNISNKTYNELPDELQNIFNDYQIQCVIYQRCEMKAISRYVRIYNNHTAMNTSQKALTYLDNFAKNVREVVNHEFFKEIGKYTDRERKNGSIERIVIESLMVMFYPDHWQKQAKRNSMFLNVNADSSEFRIFISVLDRLSKINTVGFKKIFNAKNSFVWFNVFYKFTQITLDNGNKINDKWFAKFVENLDITKYNEVSSTTRSTKDKIVVLNKIDFTMELLKNYLDEHNKEIEEDKSNCQDDYVENFSNGNNSEDNILLLDNDGNKLNNQNDYCYTKEMKEKDAALLKELGYTIIDGDLEFYNDSLEDLTVNIDQKSLILDPDNHPSLMAMVAYSYKKDIDLDEWFVDFAERSTGFLFDQKENYQNMIADYKVYMLRSNQNLQSVS